jgi:hypothetical protein
VIRRIIAVIVGVVLAVALIDGSWALAELWFAAPISPDASDQEMLAQFVMGMPLAGQAIVAAGWGLAGLVGAFAALRIAQWRPGGWIVAAVVVATGIWNLTQLAQPWWLWGATLILPLLGVWLAERHFHRARPGDPLIN